MTSLFDFFFGSKDVGATTGATGAVKADGWTGAGVGSTGAVGVGSGAQVGAGGGVAVGVLATGVSRFSDSSASISCIASMSF